MFLREHSTTGLSTSEMKNAPNMARQPRNGGRRTMRIPLTVSTTTSSTAHQRLCCLQFERSNRAKLISTTVLLVSCEKFCIACGGFLFYCGALMNKFVFGDEEMDFVRKWIRILVRRDFYYYYYFC